MAKFLVITADDFGYSKERNDGIVDCFKKGIVTNTSLMVNGVAVEDAVKSALKHNLSMGLHLNITEGIPIAESTKTSSLANNYGMFLEASGFWDAAVAGRIKKEDVRREFEAQYKKYISLVGQPPLHVDGHQHANLAPGGVYEVLAEVFAEYGVKSTRRPIDPIMDSGDWEASKYTEGLKKAVKYARESEGAFIKKGIKLSDCFFGLSTMGQDMSVDRIKFGLKRAYETAGGGIQHPVCEFMVHPGFVNGDVGGCGTGPDDFSQSEEREHEMRVLADPALHEFYKTEGIELAPISQCW